MPLTRQALHASAVFVDKLVEILGKLSSFLFERLFYNKILGKMKVTSTPWEGGESVDRHRQARWDLENLRSIGTKLTPGQYAMVRRACDFERISMYRLLRRLLLDWLMQWAAENPDRVDDVYLPLRRR